MVVFSKTRQQKKKKKRYLVSVSGRCCVPKMWLLSSIVVYSKDRCKPGKDSVKCPLAICRFWGQFAKRDLHKWTSVHYFPRCVRRELDGQYKSLDLHQHSFMRCWHCKEQCNLRDTPLVPATGIEVCLLKLSFLCIIFPKKVLLTYSTF